VSRIGLYASIMVVAQALTACSDTSPNPAAPSSPGGLRHDQTVYSSVWSMADVDADFGGRYSLDTTQAGEDATPSASYDPLTGTTEICRDHFNAIDLWWDGGHGLMSFHLDPPLLFHNYRQGTFKSTRGLLFRKAVHESVQSSEAEDPDGNVWRFRGRFNALCRAGALEIGPVVFGGQLVIAQDPVDRPVLIRRGSSGGGSGCGFQYQIVYDPYAEPSPGDCSTDGSGAEAMMEAGV
jgi:hypothetical protein